ncbi:MAG: NCS2 family permease [Verrucomicrobiota bacterium]
MSEAANAKPKWFVWGDLDGFFALFIDSLLQLLLITVFCTTPLVGLPVELVVGTILPGAALSILVGNFYYSWQAMRLARREGRDDVCALPYGINTVSLIAYVFFILAPVYQTHRAELGDAAAATLAWQVGLVACFLGALMELAGALVGDWVRRVTPRAALLSALAGVALTFLSMSFVFQIFANPAIGFLPMLIILIGYASGVRWPLRLPSGLLALLVGLALAWGFYFTGIGIWSPPDRPVEPGLYLPQFVAGDLFAFLLDPRAWQYLSIIVPMALFNVVGSLQNLESAEAAGDRFPTRSSLVANGTGSVVAALFGSPFNTTIYIGHPGWKALGARIGYSAANGLAVAVVCFLGIITAIEEVVPLEVTLGILLWIGIVITAQAFQAVPSRHMLAVALGLVPCLASWALVLIESALRAAGTTLFATQGKFIGQNVYIEGIISLDRGFLLTSMIYAAVLVFVIERRFGLAAVWMLGAAVLAAFGFLHAYELTPAGVQNVMGLVERDGWWQPAAPVFTAVYLASAALLAALWRRERGAGKTKNIREADGG